MFKYFVSYVYINHWGHSIYVNRTLTAERLIESEECLEALQKEIEKDAAVRFFGFITNGVILLGFSLLEKIH